MAMAGDISWHDSHGTFNLRVAAILTRFVGGIERCVTSPSAGTADSDMEVNP